MNIKDEEEVKQIDIENKQINVEWRWNFENIIITI